MCLGSDGFFSLKPLFRHIFELDRVEGFEEVRVGAMFHGGLGTLFGFCGSDHNDRQIGVKDSEVMKYVETTDVW